LFLSDNFIIIYDMIILNHINRMKMGQDENMIKAFHEEAESFIAPLRENYEALRSDPTDIEIIQKCFIHIHTIKGNGRFMKLKSLVSINTPTEEILDRMRENQMTANDEIIDILEKSLDATAELLDDIIKTFKEGNKDYSGLVMEIESHIKA
jgi:two-component system, chemotaxis family, sensor kinase CheA